ncbi:MAG TPA: hypothetical protein VLX92_17705 [Kofleriaceae bacterium]|nr:hypothetical protein [Kofleriaceae bacterium]
MNLAKWLLVLLLVPACFHHRAHDVTARLPVPVARSGSIDVVLNAPTRELTIAVDGALAVDRAHSRHARIANVPAGPAHVQIAVGGRCERGGAVDEQVVVPAGGIATVVLPGPEHDHLCAIATGVVHVALAALLIRPAIHLVKAVHGHFAP